MLWIGLGVVFIGAVHDFSTLVASVRHRGRSVAEIVRVEMGRRAWLAILAFIWLALVFVILAFTDITASTFVGKTEELEGLSFGFNAGGAVALASVLYLALAVVMGLVERALRPPLWLTTVVFVPATLAVVWLGTQYSTLLVADARTWGLLTLAYCFVASLVPVWTLLQPRGYLGGFVLYMALAVGRRRHLLRRLPDPAGGLQDLAGAGGRRRALPVPLRDDRLRGLLRVPRARLLGYAAS